jgi:hypothetical protein
MTNQYMSEMRDGYDAGYAAGGAETDLGALFLGSAGSLRINHGGDGYQRTPFGIGYRIGYSAAIEGKEIRTDARGEITSA